MSVHLAIECIHMYYKLCSIQGIYNNLIRYVYEQGKGCVKFSLHVLIVIIHNYSCFIVDCNNL